MLMIQTLKQGVKMKVRFFQVVWLLNALWLGGITLLWLLYFVGFAIAGFSASNMSDHDRHYFFDLPWGLPFGIPALVLIYIGMGSVRFPREK